MTGRVDQLDAWIAVQTNEDETKFTALLLIPGVVSHHFRHDTNMRGWTLLHYAAYLDRHKQVEVLLKNGADCNAVTSDGETPLQLLNKHCKDKENSRSYSILTASTNTTVGH